MKIYDISQELFTCVVYPGDPAPEKSSVLSIQNGDVCNLTKFSMCAHNGTHLDAPYHFIDEGKKVDQLDLSKVIGNAYVALSDIDITAELAEAIYSRASSLDPEAAKRILIKGRGVVTAPAARLFADKGVHLIGTEYQSVGPADAPREVHLILLSREVVLLEGLRLGDVPHDSIYLLNAAPINLGGCDGAPCRATLIDR